MDGSPLPLIPMETAQPISEAGWRWLVRAADDPAGLLAEWGAHPTSVQPLPVGRPSARSTCHSPSA
jgi:hypothetical protein